MDFNKNLKVSCGNDTALVSLVASEGGSFTPAGKDTPVTYQNGYKLSILRVGKTAVNVRLSVEETALLIEACERFADSLEA